MPTYLSNNCEHFLRAFGAEAYVIDAFDSLLPDALSDYCHAPDGGSAFTTPTFDLICKSYLQWIGQWHGRGFAFCVRRPMELYTDAGIHGACLHEYAHWLSWFKRDDRNASDGSRAWKYATDHPIRNGHNWTWLRCCCHLAFRAKKLGFDYVRLSDVARSTTYGFSRLEQYHDTLLPELKCSAKLSWRQFEQEVLPSHPPRAFRELANLDATKNCWGLPYANKPKKKPATKMKTQTPAKPKANSNVAIKTTPTKPSATSWPPRKLRYDSCGGTTVAVYSDGSRIGISNCRLCGQEDRKPDWATAKADRVTLVCPTCKSKEVMVRRFHSLPKSDRPSVGSVAEMERRRNELAKMAGVVR